MYPFATYCLLIHIQPFPQNYCSLIYHNCVLRERLHFPIWVCLPLRNWLHRILNCKKSLELFMSPSQASTKYSIAYIISIFWVPLLWFKLHLNPKNRKETIKHIYTNMPHYFINRERYKVRALCTASPCIEEVRFLFLNEVMSVILVNPSLPCLFLLWGTNTL